MNLNLTKPIAFFDLETTGVLIGVDRIVEIAIIKIDKNNQRTDFHKYINPEIPISKEVAEIHGITNERVANEPTFKQIAPQINKFLENCDLAGFNSNKFDVPILAEEFLRVGIDFSMKNRRLVDVQNIFHILEPRTLKGAYKFYCQKDLVNAHSALADTDATLEVFLAQLEKYEELKNDVGFLQDFSMRNKNVDLAGRIIYNADGVEVFNFGKHKDKPVLEVLEKEPSYYDWMMKGDFPEYTKKTLTKIRLKNFNK
jgi:DNA polymerase III subunit epsilon